MYYKNHPVFNLGMSMSFGAKVTSEWHDKFIEAYYKSKNINSLEMRSRVVHVIIQLQSQGYMEAFKKDDTTVVCEVTKIGKDLIPYIEV
jgi:predicted transport protein